MLRAVPATVFFCPQGGGVLELNVSRRVKKEMNERCPGGGDVDTALGYISFRGMHNYRVRPIFLFLLI